MPRTVVFTAVIVLMIAGLLAMLFSLLGSVAILPRLSNATAPANTMDNPHSLVRIEKVYYHTSPGEHPCNGTPERFVILKAVYRSSTASQTCIVSVDGRVQKTINLLDYDCGLDCSKETALLIDVRPQDTSEAHDINLCCSQFCAQSRLAALCPQ